MLLKTIDQEGNIVLKDYDEKECANIFLERNSYLIKRIDRFGEDYFRNDNNEKIKEEYEEIIPERILVKDDKFYGVLIQVNYSWYNGGSMRNNSYEDKIITINELDSVYARDGYSYAFEDHDRWCYSDYYLVERS